MDDAEILGHLRWLYHERDLCLWCHHPRHQRVRRGLCGNCYRTALEFRKKPSLEAAIVVCFAMREGDINAADWPIGGLELEELLESVAAMAFPWRRTTDNPFWHSANTWGESFSDAQLRLLFHHFAMVDREAARRSRRNQAWNIARELELKSLDGRSREEADAEMREYMAAAERGVRDLFGT